MAASPLAPRVLVVAGTGFLRAYSGTLYMIRGLQEKGMEVEVLVMATDEESSQYKDLGVPVISLNIGRGKLCGLKRRLRVINTIFREKSVIVTENTFLIEASFVKLIRKNSLKLVHFCQELHLKKDYPSIPRIGLLNRLGRFPDLVIDVEPNRAQSRKKHLNLSHDPWVLPNTLPLSSLPPKASKGCLAKLAGCELPEGIPIVLHMGGIGQEKPLERLIGMIEGCSNPVFFLAFCNGTKQQVTALRESASKSLKQGSFRIVDSRNRADLLASAWEADIGVIDYSPNVENTDNQRFCAPTKLYEFMALGLAILGSDNPSLEKIFAEENIGICAQSGEIEDLSAALNRLLKNSQELIVMKRNAQTAFHERHCYENSAKPVLEKLCSYLTEGLCGVTSV